MNSNRLLNCMFVAFAAILFVAPSVAHGQYKVKDVTVRGKRVGPKASRPRGKRVNNLATPKPEAAAIANVATYSAKYVVKENAQFGYAATLTSKSSMSETKWMGAFVMSTKKATPLLPDDQPDDFGTVNSFGVLKSFVKSGDRWVRNEKDDIYIPNTMNFSGTGVTGRKFTRGLEKFFDNTDQHLKIVQAIFPEVSSHESDEKRDINQMCDVQTVYQGRSITMSNAKGIGTQTTVAKDNSSALTQEFAINDKSGNQLRKVTKHQQASFDPRTRMMHSSKTFFVITESTSTIITSETNQIGFDAAMKLLKD